MDIGIGLPNAVRGVDRAGIVEWAIRAERAGFSTLGTIDRIVFANVESLIALAAAGAVTERIGLATDILIAPLRANTALLAKQAASIERLAGPGRLTLGLAVGGRDDDFAVSDVDFHTRGQAFERQLGELRRHWSGETGVGPDASPRLLVGGASDAALRRMARHGDGWTMGGGGPEAFSASIGKVRDAWSAAGRDGRPRTMALCYYALGTGAADTARSALTDYYGFAGPYAERVVAGAATDEGAVRDLAAGFEQAGVDEVIFFPTSTDPEQVDLLARVVLAQPTSSAGTG
jgi:alkanesulfonate monooxygenase SsuD/methylene tetrahydromethanopterin reductase-like flavin-dependent oxidoreductase (luciferase family)